jgi:uncharacterized protein (TIRG00374 family)
MLPSVRLAPVRRRRSDDRSERHWFSRSLLAARSHIGPLASSLRAGVSPYASTLRAGLRAYASTLRAGLRAWARQLRTVRLTPAAGLAVFLLMTVSWLTDVAVLALAFVALHSAPPWAGLLLAYCAGQIAASMPVTPGGIGVVEGSITLALVAFGGAETITLAAVLLYRLIAYWGCIPAGGLAWLALRRTSRTAENQAAATQPGPVATGVAEVESAS